MSFNPLAFSKPQVTGDVSLGPHLPKEKEPSHCGDIGWDWFLLRQFGLQTSSLYPFYKLCDNSAEIIHPEWHLRNLVEALGMMGIEVFYQWVVVKESGLTL